MRKTTNGRLWLIAFLLMIFSPLLLTTHWLFFAITSAKTLSPSPPG